jgi:hypothetical protein
MASFWSDSKLTVLEAAIGMSKTLGEPLGVIKAISSSNLETPAASVTVLQLETFENKDFFHIKHLPS